VTRVTTSAPLASRARLFAYALANTGGVLAYLPLLTLLLPGKVARIAGAARIDVLTACVIAGALVASAANILFGWWSDRTVAAGKSRRGWLVGGTIVTALSYAAVAAAGTAAELIGAVMLFQFAVNAMLAPLFALMAEEIPDAQKGVAGGLLALAAPVAAGVSALLVALPALGEGMRLAAVAAMAALCVLPLLLLAPRRPEAVAAEDMRRPHRRRDLLLAWSARLLVQVAGSALSLYLVYYFESVVRGVAPDVLAARVGGLLTLAYALPLPVAVAIGRWSDRSGRRRPFLAATAAIAALGLVAMAAAQGWMVAAAGFVVYTVGSATFLAIHSGYAMQLLPSAAHRGRDLGLLNLANTLPSLVGPALTWWLATPEDFDTVILTVAALTLAGGLTIMGVRARNDGAMSTS
jgi:MFS family permease